MKPELIAMLTWHDVTVPDAMDVFLAAKDAAATHWGFKVEGTTPESMKALATTMKENGKKTYIEVLAIDKAHCLDCAERAAACGADHLLGTVWYESVQKVCDDAGMAYSPFISLNDDTRFHGTIPQVIERAAAAEKKNISGICLSAFRYMDGDPEEMLAALTPTLKKPLIIAGSMNSYERIDFVKTLPNVCAFTMGGALFESKFGGTFAEQIDKICAYANK